MAWYYVYKPNLNKLARVKLKKIPSTEQKKNIIAKKKYCKKQCAKFHKFSRCRITRLCARNCSLLRLKLKRFLPMNSIIFNVLKVFFPKLEVYFPILKWLFFHLEKLIVKLIKSTIKLIKSIPTPRAMYSTLKRFYYTLKWLFAITFVTWVIFVSIHIFIYKYKFKEFWDKFKEFWNNFWDQFNK